MLKHIATPGLEINLLFRRVRDDVMKATSHGGEPQQPHVYASLGGQELYLSPAAATPAPAGPAFVPTRAEVVQLCESVAKNPSLGVVQSLLGVYRGTAMAPCIEARIEELRKQQEAALPAPKPAPPEPGPAVKPPIGNLAPAPKQPKSDALSSRAVFDCCMKYTQLVKHELGISYLEGQFESVCKNRSHWLGPNGSNAPPDWCRLLRQEMASRRKQGRLAR